MQTYKFVNGESFSEPTDWVAFARDAVNNRASFPLFDLDPKYGYGGPDKRLYDLYNALRGTGADTKLADAVLRVMETGTSEDRAQARLGPYQLAPNAEERIVRLIKDDRAAILRSNLLAHLLWQLFQLGAVDVARALLRLEIAKVDAPDLGLLACQYDLEWFVTHLPPYDAKFDVSTWVFYQEDEPLSLLLDALAQDSGYVERLQRDMNDKTLDRENEEMIREQLLSHPIARHWVE